jgi:hypothetical protein
MKEKGNPAGKAGTPGDTGDTGDSADPKRMDALFGPESVPAAEPPPASLGDPEATLLRDDPAGYEQVQLQLIALFGPEE